MQQQQRQEQEEVPVFIVQKCWFDGPQQPNDYSVDLRRVFTSCQVAEQVAIQSANAYNFNQESPVSTILLKTHNSATSYAFATCGKLFWVRRAFAIRSPNSSTGQIPAGTVCSITNGVIGGTGNPRSSRGNEQERNCVVLVPDDTQQAQAAAEHLRQTNANQQTLHPTTVMEPLKLQVGPPSTTMTDILQDWPDYASWKSHQNNNASNGNNKRGEENNGMWGQQSHQTVQTSEMLVDDGLAAPPPAKKRAFRS